MPLTATGFEITFAGILIREVRAIAVVDRRGPPQARIARWSAGDRTVVISTYADSPGFFENNYGRRRLMTIRRLGQPGPGVSGGTTADVNAALTGTQVIFEYDCMLVDRQISAEANGVVFFDLFFRIMDTVNAPTAPVP
jgi:hypothetical protein